MKVILKISFRWTPKNISHLLNLTDFILVDWIKPVQCHNTNPPPPPEYLTCQSAGLHKYGYVSCFRVPALCTHGATIPALPITYSSSPAGCTVHLFTSGIGTRLHSHYCGELPTYNARPRIMPLPPREPNLTRSDGRMEIQYFQGTLSWILISVCVWYNRWSSRAKLEPAGCYLAGR